MDVLIWRRKQLIVASTSNVLKVPSTLRVVSYIKRRVKNSLDLAAFGEC